MSEKIKNVYADKKEGYVEFWIKTENNVISADFDGVEFQWEVPDSDWHKITIK